MDTVPYIHTDVRLKSDPFLIFVHILDMTGSVSFDDEVNYDSRRIQSIYVHEV